MKRMRGVPGAALLVTYAGALGCVVGEDVEDAYPVEDVGYSAEDDTFDARVAVFFRLGEPGLGQLFGRSVKMCLQGRSNICSPSSPMADWQFHFDFPGTPIDTYRVSLFIDDVEVVSQTISDWQDPDGWEFNPVAAEVLRAINGNQPPVPATAGTVTVCFTYRPTGQPLGGVLIQVGPHSRTTAGDGCASGYLPFGTYSGTATLGDRSLSGTLRHFTNPTVYRFSVE